MSKIRYLTFTLLICLSAACVTQQSIQSAIAQTQAAWTPVPTQTAYPTLTPAPPFS
jgi:DNA-binding PadR family transcriptional regulator